MQRFVLGVVQELGQHDVVAGHAEQAEADHEHAGDRAAAECDLQRGVHAATRRFGRAHVGAHRNVHADETGQAGQDCADGEADRRGPAELGQADDDEQDHADDRDRPVLPVEGGARPFLHGLCDLLHALVAGGLGEDPAARPDTVDDRDEGAAQRDPQTVFLQHESSLGVRGE
jgi:hypothetical protein